MRSSFLNTKTALIAVLLAGVSTSVMAHPGHAGHGSAFVQGILHPLTGLDHLVMALSLGFLLARTFSQTRFMGLGLLALSLVGGFWLGLSNSLNVSVAEYGIVASLLVLAVSLWQRSSSVFLSGAAVLGVFHGMAHGAEVAQGVNPFAFMLGMLLTMSVLYVTGLFAGRQLKQHLPVSNKIAAVLAGVVAVLGLA